MPEALYRARNLTQDLPVSLALELVGPRKASTRPREDVLTQVRLEVRAAAIHSVSADRSPEALRLLRERLGMEKEEELRYQIIEALRADPGSVEPLRDRLHPRATDDVDVLIERSEANLRRVERALIEFVGTAPRPDALRRRGGMVRIGGDVTHIDITTKVDGLAAFEPLWDRRARGELLGEPVSYLSLRDLLRTKRAANRPKDQGDIAALRTLLTSTRRRK